MSPRVLPLALILAACGGGEAPRPAPPAEGAAVVAPPAPVEVPEPDPVPFTRRTTSPYARPLDADEAAVRERLVALVRAHGLAPDNGWAIGHALLALGADATLADGRGAVDHVFSTWATVEEGRDGPALRFPATHEGRPIEPHAALTLKVLVDLGVTPDRPVTVGGRTHTVADLWRGAVRHAWVDGPRTSFSSFNDSPWALHGIAGWAPEGARWQAEGRTQSLDDLTHALVRELSARTAFLAEAQAAGASFEKRGQEIFGFTCGGAHMIQGTAYAVARGFGRPGDREAVVGQARLQAWRFPRELAQLDDALAKAPQYRLVLLVQRLKFTGHHLETMARFAALGLVPPDDAEIAASLDAGRRELVRTVQQLHADGVLDQVQAVRAQREQTFLDLIGDGAHAVRALDLAAGTAGVAW